MSSKQALHKVMTFVEGELSRFYNFKVQSRAVDHLVSKEQMQGNGALAMPGSQGQVLIVPDKDDLFVGITFDDQVVNSLSQYLPMQQLTSKNLNAFCVIVEEVSHFHLVVNRASRDQPVTQLELEWQAEIDKLLLSSHLLHTQVHDAHFNALTLKLYHEAKIIAAEEERYWQATKLAMQFWETWDTEQRNGSNPFYSASLRRTLRECYHRNLDEKLNKLTRAA